MPGIRQSVITEIDVTAAIARPVYEAGAVIAGEPRKTARAVIQGGDTLYVEGPSLAEIADWFDKVASQIRAAGRRQTARVIPIPTKE